MKSVLSKGAKKEFDDGLLENKMPKEQHGQDTRNSLVEFEKHVLISREESKSNTIVHVINNEMVSKEEDFERKDIISVEENQENLIQSQNKIDFADNKNIDEDNLNQEIEVVSRKRKNSVANNLRKNSHIHRENLIQLQNKLELGNNKNIDEENLNDEIEVASRKRKDSVANNLRKNSHLHKINSPENKIKQEIPHIEKLNLDSEENKKESEKIDEKVNCDKQGEPNEKVNPKESANSPIKPKIIVKKIKIVNNSLPTKSAFISQQNEINILKEKLKLSKPRTTFLNQEGGLKSEKSNQETRVGNASSIKENLSKHNRDKTSINLNGNSKTNDLNLGTNLNKDHPRIKQMEMTHSIEKEQNELFEKFKNNIVEDISPSKKVRELLIKFLPKFFLETC